MSLTFTITPKGEAAREFLAISHTSGRQAIDIDPGAPHQQQYRFHSPGVDGNYLIRDGQVGRSISIIARYMGDTKDAAETLYLADCEKFCSSEVQIDYSSQTLKGCNLRPESMRRSAMVRPTGRLSGQVYFNVSMVFTQDNPEGL